MQAGFRGDQCSERPALWEFILRRPVGGMLYDANLILLRKFLLTNSFSGFTLSLGRVKILLSSIPRVCACHKRPYMAESDRSAEGLLGTLYGVPH